MVESHGQCWLSRFRMPSVYKRSSKKIGADVQTLESLEDASGILGERRGISTSAVAMRHGPPPLSGGLPSCSHTRCGHQARSPTPLSSAKPAPPNPWTECRTTLPGKSKQKAILGIQPHHKKSPKHGWGDPYCTPLHLSPLHPCRLQTPKHDSGNPNLKTNPAKP